MKKIKYIMLAVVLCLGLIGGAYAYWTDQVVVSGTVATGDIDVIFDGVEDVKYYSDDPDNAPVEIATGDLPANTAAVFVIGDQNEGINKKLTVTIDNAFPWLATTAQVTIKNDGSVPVKLEDITISPAGVPNLPFGQFQPHVGEINVALLDNSTTPGVPAALVMGQEIEAGGTLVVEFVAHALGAQNGNLGVDQDDSYAFDITMDWIQWNAP